jgi:integrase
MVAVASSGTRVTGRRGPLSSSRSYAASYTRTSLSETDRDPRPRAATRPLTEARSAGTTLDRRHLLLRFHDLRHTFASLLIAQGLNVVFVSRQLGHASPSFTLNVYGGLFDRAEHARRATNALETNFSQTLTFEAA